MEKKVHKYMKKRYSFFKWGSLSCSASGQKAFPEYPGSIVLYSRQL